jgi:hypothetical protein
MLGRLTALPQEACNTQREINCPVRNMGKGQSGFLTPESQSRIVKMRDASATKLSMFSFCSGGEWAVIPMSERPNPFERRAFQPGRDH